jgi:hypothetical protein
MPDDRRRPVTWSTVIALGPGSRHFAHRLPTFVATYTGVPLRTLDAFRGMELLMPRTSAGRIALLRRKRGRS